MKDIITRKIKVVTNAGGMNPEGLKAVIEQLTRVRIQLSIRPWPLATLAGGWPAGASGGRSCGRRHHRA